MEHHFEALIDLLESKGLLDTFINCITVDETDNITLAQRYREVFIDTHPYELFSIAFRWSEAPGGPVLWASLSYLFIKSLQKEKV